MFHQMHIFHYVSISEFNVEDYVMKVPKCRPK